MLIEYDYATNLITVRRHRLDGVTKFRHGWHSRNSPHVKEKFVSKGELTVSVQTPPHG